MSSHSLLLLNFIDYLKSRINDKEQSLSYDNEMARKTKHESIRELGELSAFKESLDVLEIMIDEFELELPIDDYLKNYS